MLDETVTIHDAGRTRTMSKAELAILALCQKALKGDVKAFRIIMDLIDQTHAFARSS
jgi:hypothetical protein